ncbi:zincin-like metallopeptidase domain-containing protein [Shewanella sp. 4t3-1-2LB]|uniref:zincin-like metallopeptidase domain-containing protein n=1 Tax=Shewanella sp. 4t3-1-2LB TaxID=2817682 RepID=UPI001F62337C|nr:zincin-like metallopeptidase domain-containing protein [Shewanella sp. 4t3-1-2LB]
MTNKVEKKPFHVIVAEKLIAQLEEGVAPWQKPWVPGKSSQSLPFNPTTGKRYKGINTLNLMAQGYDDPRWMTYEQAKKQDAQVMKGERSTLVQYWKFTEEQKVLDDNGNPIMDENGKPKTFTVQLERPKVFFASVFNAEQIDGLPPLEIKPLSEEQTWQAISRAEKILNLSGARISHVSQDRAFYSPMADRITLPQKNQFPDASSYYATALHELGHWTGHSTRLNRDLGHPFGSEGYAKEELRAEISSMIMGDELGIGHDPKQHAAYVKSWIKALKDDPQEIFRAASDAEKIQTLLLSYELQQEQTQEVKLEIGMNDDAFESWINLREYALTLGLDATLAKRSDTDDSYAITYHVGTREMPLNSILLGSGKVSTVFSDGKGDNADFLINEDDQTAALETAVSRLVAHYLGAPTSTETEPMDVDHQATVNLSQAIIGVRAGEIPSSAISLVGKTPLFHSVLPGGLNINPLWDGMTKIVEPNNDGVPVDPRFNNASNQYILLLRLSDDGKVWDKAAAFNTEEDAKRVEALMLNAYAKTLMPDDAELQHLGGVMVSESTKVYIDVPYKDKENAKAAGAKWDRAVGHWSIDSVEAHKISEKWPIIQVEPVNTTRLYIAVPFNEKDQAKAAGAKWDKNKKSWYVKPGTDKEVIAKWLVENRQTEQLPALTPREELAQAMKDMGFDVNGDHPIMDGMKHRCRLTSDKSSVTNSNGSGMYVAFLDGIPAAYLSNNRTGESMNWSSKGYSMTDEEKATLRAESAAKLQAREAAVAAERQSVSEGLQRLLEVSHFANGSEAYLTHKQASAGNLLVVPEPSALKDDPKILIGATKQESKALRDSHPNHLVFTTGDLLVPAHDTAGHIWTVQTILDSGTKLFPKGSQKTGSFHVVGGNMDTITKTPVLMIAEGYATADTLSEAAGLPVVSAFDAGNLIAVANALREMYPEKPILICGDDDAHLVMTEGKNTGREKAAKAAESVGGDTLFPVFAPNEQHYPDKLAPVTPELWRSGNATPEQSRGIDTMKGYTDFNDVKTKSVLGIDGVKRQVTFAIKELLQRHTQQSLAQAQHMTNKAVRTQRVGTPT